MKLETIVGIIVALLLTFMGHWFVGIILGILLWVLIGNAKLRREIATDMKIISEKFKQKL